MTETQHIGAGGFWDKTGAALSWLCAIHCLALPALAAALPLAGLAFLLDERVELAVVGLSALVSAAALRPAFLRRPRRRPLIPLLLAGGLACLAGSHFWLEDALAWKIPALLGGAALISAAHLLNYRAGRCF